MSIKTFFLKIGRFCVFPLLVSALVLCLAPVKGYGWFHTPKALDVKQGRDGLPVFKDKRTTPNTTKTYSLLQNRGEKKTPILYPGSMGAGVTAGTVNIDISFDVLSKTAIYPEISLDRQIAANLRLKRIIDEYLSLKKRNAEVIKGLGIPYLEKKKPLKNIRPDPVPEKITAEKKARETMENVIIFSGDGRDAQANRQAAVSRFARDIKKERQKITPAGEVSKPRPSPEYLGESVETAGKDSYPTAYGSNTDLPWFFSFILKLIRSAAHNKLDIFLWTVVLIISGLIGIVVVKR